MQKKLMALLTSLALAGVTAACKDRRYGEDKDQVAGKPLDDRTAQGGTTNAAGALEDKTIAAADPEAKHDIDNARSTYGVNVSGAEAIAHFNASGTNKLRGVAAIDGQALTVAVADAPPGKYLVELSDQAACDVSKPIENTKGEHVLGFLVVGQDGQGRFEANVSGELIANAANRTIVIKTSEGEDISRGELRGSVACGELSPAESGGQGA